jgi:hypothetical protein
VAFVTLLLGLCWPALQHVRDDGNRATCANNLRQLVLASHSFCATNGTLPPYWGAYPTQDSLSIKGGWFCHLLPYTGETTLYGEMMADIAKSGVNWDIELPDPAANDATPARLPATKSESGPPLLREVVRYNGHSHWEPVSTSASDQAAGSGQGRTPADKDTKAFSDSNSPKQAGPGGIFRPEFSGKSFPLLQCPSDPSPGSYPDAGAGRVYLTRNQIWGSTNYVANWHALANNNPQSGYLCPPQTLESITDGLANTVLFSEAYSWCDGKGRLALNSWDYHSFGLTWSLGDAIIDDGNGPRHVDFPRGMPNTYLFQIQPSTRETPDCPSGSDCCNNWRAQTAHGALNAGMADGSVHEFARGTSQRVWDHALLPRDGAIPGWEW